MGGVLYWKRAAQRTGGRGGAEKNWRACVAGHLRKFGIDPDDLKTKPKKIVQRNDQVGDGAAKLVATWTVGGGILICCFP